MRAAWRRSSAYVRHSAPLPITRPRMCLSRCVCVMCVCGGGGGGIRTCAVAATWSALEPTPLESCASR
jgi:hypothetical protein